MLSQLGLPCESSGPLSGCGSTVLMRETPELLSCSCSLPNRIGRPSPLIIVEIFNCLDFFLGTLFEAAIFKTWNKEFQNYIIRCGYRGHFYRGK